MSYPFGGKFGKKVLHIDQVHTTAYHPQINDWDD